MMPIFLYMGWMSFLITESLPANSIDAAMHIAPPIVSVQVTPILPARAPAARLPIGAMPMNDIV